MNTVHNNDSSYIFAFALRLFETFTAYREVNPQKPLTKDQFCGLFIWARNQSTDLETAYSKLLELLYPPAQPIQQWAIPVVEPAPIHQAAIEQTAPADIKRLLSKRYIVASDYGLDLNNRIDAADLFVYLWMRWESESIGGMELVHHDGTSRYTGVAVFEN
jgi:hypothetical protein